MKFAKQCLSFVLSSWLLATTVPAGFADQSTQSASQIPVQAAQQTPEQLQQLVAPIALVSRCPGSSDSRGRYVAPDQVVEAGPMAAAASRS